MFLLAVAEFMCSGLIYNLFRLELNQMQALAQIRSWPFWVALPWALFFTVLISCFLSREPTKRAAQAGVGGGGVEPTKRAYDGRADPACTTVITRDERAAAKKTFGPEQTLLRLLKAAGAPVTGNVFLALSPVNTWSRSCGADQSITFTWRRKRCPTPSRRRLKEKP